MFATGHQLILTPVSSACDSGLGREFGDGLVIRVLKKVLLRPSRVGAHTLVYGASAGPESHGQYLPDCEITPTGGLTKGKEGAALQARVWKELSQKLEAIRPGATSFS